MDPVVPRLHSEFFTLRLRIENILREHLHDSVFQPILDAAIAKYVEESRYNFQHYLLDELRRHPHIYRIIDDVALEDILAGE